MAKKTLKSLNKAYETENFFEVIIESYINGNFTQCREQYRMMREADRKAFLIECVNNDPIQAINIMRVVL